MSVTTATRLPGISFEVAPRAPSETLPRMDVCAFVGFASCGPVDVPVAVESIARFREVFGPDVALARDPASGRTEGSYLGPAVESFFRCGGERCWVVRLARAPEVADFEIPGLARATADAGAWALGAARARSGGTWPDNLRVAATISLRWVPATAGRAGFDPALRTVEIAPTTELRSGDLLRVTSPGLPGAGFVVVSGITASRRSTFVEWRDEEAYWLTDPVPVEGEVPSSVFRLTAGAPEPVDVEVVALTKDAPGPQLYQVGLASLDQVEPGDVLRVDYAGHSVVLPVGTILPAADAVSPGRIAAEAGPGSVIVAGGLPSLPGWWDDPAAVPVVEHVTLDLLVWEEQRLAARLGGLAFSERHPRSWRRLPDDDELFRAVAALAEGSGAPVTADRAPLLDEELWAEAFSPRFPLATTPEDEVDAGEGLWLPLALGDVADPSSARGPHDSATEALAREGLEEFGAELFLDPVLAPLTAQEVLRVAEDRAFLSSPPIPSTGLHSLFPVDEVTVVAVPDASQRGWQKVGIDPPEILGAPVLVADATSDEELWLSWSQVQGATSYELQESEDPRFDDAHILERGPALEVAAAYEGCPAVRYFRVRAARENVAGPWSNTRVALVPASAFEDCNRLLEPTELSHAGPASPPEPLVWTAVEGAEAYEVQTSQWPDFRSFESFEVAGTEAGVEMPDEVALYYRVAPFRTNGDAREPGPWSNTIALAPPARQVWAMRPPEDTAEDLAAVQRSLLRLCCARNDLLAVLSFPSGWRDEEVLPHVALLAPWTAVESVPPEELAAGVPGLDAGEIGALGFAAAYHPWIVTRSVRADGEEMRPIPPDGAVCGRIARRSILRGAWIAPANEALDVGLGLEPRLDRAAEERLAGQSVNVIRAEPRGCVVAGADTLSHDAYLRPINVRRLLILLRRYVLREGNTYVFQPHDATFRSMVVRKLESMLGDLFRRGAFAGRTPAEGFVVVGDDSVNPPLSVDQGRFVVDVLVAPSVPAKYVRVRLLQTGPGAVLVEEGVS